MTNRQIGSGFRAVKPRAEIPPGARLSTHHRPTPFSSAAKGPLYAADIWSGCLRDDGPAASLPGRVGWRRCAGRRRSCGEVAGEEAAGLLEMDPRTVVQIQRLDQIAMLVYPGPGRGVDAKGRVYGETGEGDASEAQRRAGSEYWRIAEAMRPKIRLLIVV